MAAFEEKNIVLFDMDNTLVVEDTGDLWGKFLDNKGIVNETEKQKRLKLNNDYLEGRLDPVENFQFEISLIKKIPHEKRENWRNEFFENHVKQYVSQQGLSLIEEYKKDKSTIVVLITATLSYIALPVAHYAGVHDLIATEAERKNNDYTGYVFGTACLQEGKVNRFNDWMQEKKITPAHTILYSDSINDLPLLSIVREPIIVDPDNYLRKIAVEKNWKITSFK
jgi:HAD superfamily hydrolase (TIGR01490 family)